MGRDAEHSLTRVRSQDVKAALHGLMEEFGFALIPSEVLARIRVPVALIWGRHDLATSLSAAQEASARFGWPLQVVEDAADDPAMEQPERFLAALRAAVG